MYIIFMFWLIYIIYSSIAQSVEHAAVNRRVVGSSPTWGAKNRSIHRRWVLLFFVMQFEDGAVTLRGNSRTGC